jgi:hypothetical protein
MPKMNTVSSKISSMSFGMVSADFRHFMTDLCISLFFPVFASKIDYSLIVINNQLPKIPNQFQREFLFNNGIHSQNISSASKYSRQKTNLFKQRRAVTSRRRHRGVLSLRAADTEACCHFAPPTQRRAVTLRRRKEAWGWGILSLCAASF